MQPRNIAVLVVLLLCSLTGFAQTPASSPAKRQDIMHLLQMIGAAKAATQGFDFMLPSLKEAMPQVPEDVWRDLRGEIRDDDMLELTAKIWDKHFTHEEIRDLTRFYMSPTGQKVVKELPAIQDESMAAGQKWGKEILSRIMQRLREKGYRVPDSLSDGPGN